jgi:hypothetical protein
MKRIVPGGLLTLKEEEEMEEEEEEPKDGVRSNGSAIPPSTSRHIPASYVSTLLDRFGRLTIVSIR